MSQPSDIDKTVIGYILNAEFSAASQAHIKHIQTKLLQELPHALWLAPGPALHITLADLLAPLVAYGEDKDVLFARLRPGYIRALQEVFAGEMPIDVHFDTVNVYPNAVVISGDDDGSYQRIRERILQSIDLLPDTKLPPTIIHSTICRFTRSVDINPITALAQTLPVSFHETTRVFRLVKETKVFMQTYQHIQRFELS